MGWRGALRSMGAAVRAAERESRRRQRDLERRQATYAKMQELDRAAYEVEVYENLIERLLSVHKDGAHAVDWAAIVAKQAPAAPVRSTAHEDRAREALERYQASILDRLLRRVPRRRAELERKMAIAKEHDGVEFQQAIGRYKQAHAEWQESHGVAERIIAGDPTAYTEVIQELDPFSELGDLGSKLLFEVRTAGAIEALLQIHGDQVIPKQSKGLLKSGKLSVKPLPPTKFYGLYQDYVCSAVLRVARDVLAILPVNMVIVTALDMMLNPESGHREEQPVLSVAISRTTLESLNLQAVDPSDAMRNFVHRMGFKKSQGFAPVVRLQLSELGKPG